jgi:CTP:molybdopterin cytidylyltransferase MocA
MKDVSAIVLAAGRSRRMGQFKPLLPFGDRTVIDHCIDNLSRGGVESIVVVVGHRAADLQNHLQTANVVFAVNPAPDSEMSDSVARGVSQIPSSAEAILITPADHPAVPAAVVARIIRSWQEGAGLVVPTWNGRGGHPVLVDSAFRDALLGLDPGLGLRSLFESHPGQVTRLSVDSSYIARDMDTWDDYVSLHKDVFGVLPRQPFDQTEPGQPRSPQTN